MIVAPRLRRRSTASPADALFLASSDLRHLATLCARLGGPALPVIHPVAGGFLVVVAAPPGGLPRIVPLRRLAGNLFVPADADLVPPLRPDEAVDLTRRRGLVILPGVRALAFDLDRMLTAAEVIAPTMVRRDEWEPFPARPARAERLHTIEREGIDVSPDEIFEAGRPGEPDADEPEADTRPADAPPLRRAVGKAAMGIGRFLTWLGRLLRRPGLARAGARMIARAAQAVPRLTERILGRQEAALRELLRKFRSGDVEQALRQAPQLADADGRPVRPDTASQLGDRDPRYSLAALLGGGGGSGGAWFSGGDIWTELVAEYRRAADLAAARGDYRRAAYIHGVLLRDFRTAANLLAAGGLYRDAAIVARDRLNDVPAAASFFERAGEFDEALRLYRQADMYDRAGDLLRRLGDEGAALDMYLLAARKLTADGHWLAAGDLVRDRAGRADLATEYYAAGWTARPQPDAPICAERLLTDRLSHADMPAVWALLDEAEWFFAAPARRAEAGAFFGTVARVAVPPLPESVRVELRDRARLALAGRLREAAGHATQPGTLVSDLFGREPAWSPPLVRDAADALRRALQPKAAADAPCGEPVPLLQGTVTAVAVARKSGDVFIGSAAGDVVCWRADGTVERVAREPWRPITAVATDAQGRLAVVLQCDGERGRLRSYRRVGRFVYAAERELRGPEGVAPTLVPDIREQDGRFLTEVESDDGLESLRGSQLVPSGPSSTAEETRLVLSIQDRDWWRVWGGSILQCWQRSPTDQSGAAWQMTRWGRLPWQPGIPEGSPLLSPVFDWATPRSGELNLAGVTADGVVYWSALEPRDATSLRTRVASTADGTAYRAAAFVGPGWVAAVTATNEVHWLRPDGTRLRLGPPPHRLPVPARAVAAAFRPATGELAVILVDGTAVRLARPR